MSQIYRSSFGSLSDILDGHTNHRGVPESILGKLSETSEHIRTYPFPSNGPMDYVGQAATIISSINRAVNTYKRIDRGIKSWFPNRPTHFTPEEAKNGTRSVRSNMPYRRRFRRRYYARGRRRFRRYGFRRRRYYRRSRFRRKRIGALSYAMRHFLQQYLVSENVTTGVGWSSGSAQNFALSRIEAYNGTGVLNHEYRIGNTTFLKTINVEINVRLNGIRNRSQWFFAIVQKYRPDANSAWVFQTSEIWDTYGGILSGFNIFRTPRRDKSHIAEFKVWKTARVTLTRNDNESRNINWTIKANTRQRYTTNSTGTTPETNDFVLWAVPENVDDTNPDNIQITAYTSFIP